MTDKSIIWKISPQQNWRLYKHTDYKPPEIQAPVESKDPKKPSTNGPIIKNNINSPFSFTKTRPITKGSVVCTPKGYATINSFNEDSKTITVKIEGQLYEFSEQEVTNEIALNIVCLNNSLRTEQIMHVSIHSTISELFEKLQNLNSNSDNCFAISLFHSGKELVESNETIEKLKIMPHAKILGVQKMKKPLFIKRYQHYYTGWSITSGQKVGISFSPSKTIRVIGFGMYKASKGGMEGTAKLSYGFTTNDEVYSKSFSLPDLNEKEEIERVYFNRSFLVKEGEFISINITFTNTFTTGYGGGGKATQLGDGEVNFNFKVHQDLTNMHSVDSGQIPELLYYV